MFVAVCQLSVMSDDSPANKPLIFPCFLLETVKTFLQWYTTDTRGPINPAFDRHSSNYVCFELFSNYLVIALTPKARLNGLQTHPLTTDYQSLVLLSI